MYEKYLSQLEQGEEDRKESIERRGVAVITTSGALATLLLGLAAIARGADSPLVVPEDARTWVVRALIAFGVAALLAVATSMPLGYKGAKLSDLRDLIEADEETEGEALKLVVDNRLTVLSRASLINDVKAWCLVVAMFAEVIGVALIGYVGWLAI